MVVSLQFGDNNPNNDLFGFYEKPFLFILMLDHFFVFN